MALTEFMTDQYMKCGLSHVLSEVDCTYRSKINDECSTLNHFIMTENIFNLELLTDMNRCTEEIICLITQHYSLIWTYQPCIIISSMFTRVALGLLPSRIRPALTILTHIDVA